VINIDKEDIEASPALASADVESAFIKGVVKLGDRLLILLDVDRVLSDEERTDIGAMDAAPGQDAEGTRGVMALEARGYCAIDKGGRI